MVPYLASAAWYSAWLKSFLSSGDDEEAIAAANIACGISGKDFSRCVVEGGGGRVILSVAVEGGASRLKKCRNLSEIGLSGHGNWPHAHLGALDAIYGRMPYYRHLIPLLTPLYGDFNMTLRGFCRDVHSAVVRFLGVKDDFGRKRFAAEDVCKWPAMAARGSEIAASLRPDLSIVHSVMRYGPETVAGLLFLETGNSDKII